MFVVLFLMDWMLGDKRSATHKHRNFLQPRMVVDGCLLQQTLCSTYSHLERCSTQGLETEKLSKVNKKAHTTPFCVAN